MDQSAEKSNRWSLPAPSKPVGFTSFNLTDVHRPDPSNIQEHRQFEVLVWYPAHELSQGTSKVYLTKVCPTSFFNFDFGSKNVRNAAKYLKTNSIENVAVSESRQRYPVLLFSHDLGSMPEYYTALMEHLACEGYFVFSINHPRLSESLVIEETAGKKKKIFRLDALLDFKWAVTFSKAKRKLLGKSYAEKWGTSRTLLLKWRSHHRAFDEMQKDRMFLLNFLQGMNSSLGHENPFNIFSRRLDLSTVGAIGHGWGGASAVDSLIFDPRVKVAVNLDGLQLSNATNFVIDKPLLTIYSRECSGINDGIYFSSAENEAYTVENSMHNSFTDSLFIDEEKTNDLSAFYNTVTLVVGFFDKHLKKINHLSFIKKTSRGITIL